MARRCSLTGKAVLSGNMVSHSNRKTKKRFLPNLQRLTILSDALGPISLRISTKALRSIDKNGGIDNYLLSKSDTKLTIEALVIKKSLKKHLAKSE